MSPTTGRKVRTKRWVLTAAAKAAAKKKRGAKKKQEKAAANKPLSSA